MFVFVTCTTFPDASMDTTGKTEDDNPLILMIWWGPSCSDDGFWSGLTAASLKRASAANSWTDSTIFSRQVMTSTSCTATIAVGITSNRMKSSQELVLSNNFRACAAVFAFTIWGFTGDGFVMVLIAVARSFNAFPDSILILVQESSIWLRIPSGACKN